MDVTNLSPSVSSSGGNLVSTATDLATFYDALFDGELPRSSRRREAGDDDVRDR